MTTSDYKGDVDFCIFATGDVCKGDHVRFERATFSGSFRNAKFAGFERITGEVIADSYGAAKQQHTFTLRLYSGETLRIKGRNLYREGVWRKPWPEESERRRVLQEKHTRGDAARVARSERKGFSHDT